MINQMHSPNEHQDETIPFSPGGVIEGRSTWESESKQETSFRGMNLRMKVLREHIAGLYQKLSKITGQTLEAFHFDGFKIRDGKLYNRDKSTPLMNKQNKLRSVGFIAGILAKEGFHSLGFDIP